MLTDVFAILCGSGVGFILGLIGGGGSVVATPMLLYIVGLEPHAAIGTGALAVSVNAFVNFAGHARAGNVRWAIGAIFAAAGVLGASIGSTIGKAFDGKRLVLLFAFVMIAVGILMVRPRKTAGNAEMPMTAAVAGKVAGTALGVGMLSGFFGIGGGFLIVPGLIFSAGLPMINAVGTSLLGVGAFGLTTAVNYALSDLVNWGVAAEFIGGGMVGGWIGMRAALRLAHQRQTLSRIFAGVVFAVAFYIIWRSAG